MMDIRLQVFKAVAEKKSFSQAAHDLFMTQSTVSQHIQTLETQYGVKLFDRLHRRIALTPAGEKLYPYAAAIDRLYQETDNAMNEAIGKVSGRLHIGASMTIGEYLLPEILVAFRQQFPAVDIIMEIFNTEQILALVVEGKVDVGFIEGPHDIPPQICALPCGGDELVVVAAPVHPVASQEAVPVENLLDHCWVMREKTSGTRRAFESYLTGLGYDPATINIVMELGSTQAVKKAVQAELGIAALSDLAVRDELTRGELTAVTPSEGAVIRNFSLLYHQEKFRPHTIEQFCAFIRCPSRSKTPASISGR